MEHEHESAERRAERAGEAERKPSLRAKLSRALSDLRADTLSRYRACARAWTSRRRAHRRLLRRAGRRHHACAPAARARRRHPGGADRRAARARRGSERLAALADHLDQSLESLKDLQWEVREREARYRDLLDHQGDVILRRDADQRLSFVNDAFCRTFGLTRDAALGSGLPAPGRDRAEAGRAGGLAEGRRGAAKPDRRACAPPRDRAGSCGRTSPSPTPTAA